MDFDTNNFIEELKEKLKTFDKEGVTKLCDELISFLYRTPDGFSIKEGEKVLSELKNKRMFALMQKVGSVLIQTDRQSPKIRKLYSQSLIDQNFFTAALAYLNNLTKDTKEGEPQNLEARGLTGRVYKQLYVNAKNSSNPKNIEFLKKALNIYYEVYKKYPDELWHGINTVALLQRAERDKVDLSGSGFPDSKELAQTILTEIEELDLNKKSEVWSATAVEACVALNKPDDALKWLAKYLSAPYVDAFELASTLRQFEEVWQFNMDSEIGKLILPMLRAELLKRQGGLVTMGMNELQQQKLNEKANSKTYERVFSDESFKTYNWYMTGADRCLAVARIGKESAKGFGTGFLMRGISFHEKLKDEFVLLTNSHVISDDPDENSLRSDEAVIIFEVLNKMLGVNDEFRGCEIIWSSPSNKLDATIIRFKPEDLPGLKKLTESITFYPVSKWLPVKNNGQRVYIIGHPAGGTLQLSFLDNLLLDHNDPRIHYRTPTIGGSSGSPVFNDSWQLIGIHHAGDENMLKLDGTGTYEANEGMWIQAVIREAGKSLGK